MFTDQRKRQRKIECFGCGKIGHFVEDCPNKPKPKPKPKPKDKKKERRGKGQALTTIKTWDNTSSEEEDKHGGTTTNLHQALRTFASWPKITMKVQARAMKVAIMTLLSSSISSYQELASKFDSIEDYNVEQLTKLKNLKLVQVPLKTPKMVSLFDIIKKHASTSCIDLIELDSPPCNKSCVEHVIVDSCTDKVAIENEVLKQEVDHLTKDLVLLKGKTKQAQPNQDNIINDAKKLDEGEIMCATNKATSPSSTM